MSLKQAREDAFVVLNEDPFGRTATEMARHVEGLLVALGESREQEKGLRETLRRCGELAMSRKTGAIRHLVKKELDIEHFSPAQPEAHVCPDCKTERADYEGPDGQWLHLCPNCGSEVDPVRKVAAFKPATLAELDESGAQPEAGDD